MAEDFPQRDAAARRLLDAICQPRRTQGMSAEGEEIVINANAFHAQYLREAAAQQLFCLVSRRDIVFLRPSRDLGQRFFI